MKSIILFLFVSLAAFAEPLIPPPVTQCDAILLPGTKIIFVCVPDPKDPPTRDPTPVVGPMAGTPR